MYVHHFHKFAFLESLGNPEFMQVQVNQIIQYLYAIFQAPENQRKMLKIKYMCCNLQKI